MKLVIALILTLLIGSCSQKASLDMYRAELPDSSMINDVLIQLSQIDSFRTDYRISDKLIIPVLYKWTKWNNDSIPPPPPPPSSISYDELFQCFGHDSANQRRYDDSVFIKLQLDTLRRFTVSDQLINRFSNNNKGFYIFDIPVFSFNKKFVLISYWKNCGSLCGSCYQVLLKKDKLKWIKIKSWSCGDS